MTSLFKSVQAHPIQRRLALAIAALLVGATAQGFSTAAHACRDGDVHASSHHHHDDAKSSHAALGQKANGSGVMVEGRTAKSMAIGQASPVTLSFGAATAAGAKATLRAPKGATLTLADGSPVGEIALAVGKPTSVDVLVTASEDGLQYLDVTTTQNGRASVRSVALRVGSGEARLKSAGRVEVNSAGQRVKIMQGESR